MRHPTPNKELPKTVRWNAERADAVIAGLRRLADRGLLSETECEQLMLRIASLSSAPTIVARPVAAARNGEPAPVPAGG